MLIELAVRNLGVIAEARIPFGAGLTALTGETGAGKTMVVEALNLLAGGRADPTRVRPGAGEAVVEGLFVSGDTEWVLRRVIPAGGRSRCYLNGELTTAAQLADLTSELMEVHGQHAQQALMTRQLQRESLDAFAGVDLEPLQAARTLVKGLDAELEELGGDERDRTRQADLLRYQIAEISEAALHLGEDRELSSEGDYLGDAVQHREAGRKALGLLCDDGAGADLVARAVDALAGRHPYRDLHERLTALQAELADCVIELRDTADAVQPDEERLDWIRRRRQLIVDLERKYGDDIAEVLLFEERARAELRDLESATERRGQIAAELEAARVSLLESAEIVGKGRRSASGRLGVAVEAKLGALALAGAHFEVQVEDSDDLPDGSKVTFLLSANKGVPVAELTKAASGGELSRVMLALRLVLTAGPPTMVFDEVDAGVGGESAIAVGRALSDLGRGDPGSAGQVLVVTHLPQVAAFADNQVLAMKRETGKSTVTTITALDDESMRVKELARMLSGSPDSKTAVQHARELLDAARTQVG